MNYKQISLTTISLNKEGVLFVNNGVTIQKMDSSNVTRNGLGFLSRDPYQHFFRTPFNSISYVKDGNVLEEFSSHPSSFYPGSPFDVFSSVRSYLVDNKVVFPRFYLYPSSACNSKCIICPFRFRHENPFFIPLETVKGIIDFMHGQTPRPKSLSVIISGDGEPTLHPSIGSILGYMHQRDIKIFLTSNLVMPRIRTSDKLKAIADNVSMLTVSVKGLFADSYNKYHGTDSFYRVMDNIEKLDIMLKDNGRRKDVLFGVASLILPENTGHYEEIVGRFVELGLDYVYLNVVEPSYHKWGISFSEQQKQQTLNELDSLDQFKGSGTMIRYSKELFNGTTGQSVYFDANGRHEPSVCGSALWNPLFMSEDRRTSMIACRSSDKFQNKDFIFGQTDDAKNMGDLTLPSNIARVMSNTSKCFNCRLERQVRLFDDLIRIEQTHGYGGEFVLNFKKDVAESKIGTTFFESTFNRNK